MSPWPFPFGFGAVRSIIPLYIFNSDDGLDEGYRTKNVAEIGSGCCGVFVANFWYVNSGLYLKERAKFSPVAAKLDSAFLYGDVVYLGESSNTSFNPWTDTLGYSVSEFLQMYLPQNRVRGYRTMAIT